VGHERDQLRTSLVDGLQLRSAGLGLALDAALLDDPREQVGDRSQVGHVRWRELATVVRLHVEDADDLVVPHERHGQHRDDEPALVDAAHPQESIVVADVRDHDRLARGGHAPGHATAEGHLGAPDLEAIEAVGRRKGQVLLVAIEEVERGDAGVEGIARLVDDGLEQLLPRPGGRRHAGDAMQEPQLVELLACGGAGLPGCRLDGLRHPATIPEAVAAAFPMTRQA